MDHGVQTVLRKDLFKRSAVQQVDLIESRAFVRYLLDAVDHFNLRIAQIVGNDNVIAGIQKLHHRVAPNKTRTARHQYRHGSCSSLFRLFLADFAFFAQSNPFCSNFDIYQDFFRLFSLA